MHTPVRASSKKLSLLTPTRSGLMNQGSRTKTGYRWEAPWMAASKAGLSCSLSPFLNQSNDRCVGATGMAAFSMLTCKHWQAMPGEPYCVWTASD